MFASFGLGNSELALSVSSLQEVVNYPDKITAVPLAPNYLVGLFHLRGVVIPIVDIAKFLNVPNDPEAPNRKVAIVLCDQVRVGLLFDSTSEIINVFEKDISQVNPSADERRSVVKSVLKLDSGNRLVDVIDPGSLLKLGNLPELLAKKQNTAPETEKRNLKRGQCITFLCGSMEFALKIGSIREIIKVPEIRRTVLSMDFCMGVVNLRGTIIPIIDFRQFLKVDSSQKPDAEAQRIIILKLQKIQVGFLVDSVNSINTYFEDEVLPLPLFEQERIEMMDGVLPHKEGAGAIILKEQNILTDAEILRITQGHTTLYGGEASHIENAKKAMQRQSYLSFRLEYLLSARLNTVDEIAVVNETLACPPGFPKYVIGVLTMRGELVTVIDLRGFYGLSPAKEYMNSRMLIIKGEKNKFGLVVDAIESIDTIDESQKMKIPMVLARDVTEALHGHMKEVVETTDIEGKKKTFMILEMPELLKNLEKLAA